MIFDTASLKDRSSLYRTVRRYFDDRGYLEADTPVLTPSPIPESHIALFRTESVRPGECASDFFLVPSPEVWLKLLLAEGAPSLYQIAPCFRNGEQADRWHRPEFRMLEWYAVDASAADNIAVMQDVLDACVATVRPEAPQDVSGRIRVITMEEAFRDFAGFSLEADLRNAGWPDAAAAGSEEKTRAAAETAVAEKLASRLRERGLPDGGYGSAWPAADAFRERETADDLFHRLFLTLVEDRLPAERPLVLTDWPSLVPTLARTVPGTPWAERWELYIRGVEVANCYGEETDAARLAAYWLEERRRLKNCGGESAAIAAAADGSDWPAAIAAGLPSCSGAAVGLDRLLALIRGERGLEGLDLFSKRGMMRR